MLKDNEIHLWLREVDQDCADNDGIGEGILSPEEIDRAARYRFPRDQRLFRFAHTFLRQTLASYLDIAPHDLQFSIGSHGRPELIGGELRFNLTHTEGLVGCVVTHSADCGVDAEALDRRADQQLLSARVFTVQEQEAFQNAAEDERSLLFFKTWTLKEAYIKARGLGLALPLREISFDLSGVEPTGWFGTAVNDVAEQWRYWSGMASDGHVYGVAVRSPHAVLLLR